MSESVDKQVLFDGRWVDKEHFTAFVYNSAGQKLAKSYDEFSEMIASGAWFASKKDMEKPDIDNVVKIKGKRARKCHNPHSL